jgi:hypothetical protein
MLTAQFKETNHRLPTPSEFSSLVSPMLDSPLAAPVPLAVTNLDAVRVTSSSARVSATLAQGFYGDDRTAAWVFWGPNDGGVVSNVWANHKFLGINTKFNPTTVTALLPHLKPKTPYFFRFEIANKNGSAWSPTASEFTP